MLVGCGAVTHQLTLEDGFPLDQPLRIEVADVTNVSNKRFDPPAEQMLARRPLR